MRTRSPGSSAMSSSNSRPRDPPPYVNRLGVGPVRGFRRLLNRIANDLHLQMRSPSIRNNVGGGNCIRSRPGPVVPKENLNDSDLVPARRRLARSALSGLSPTTRRGERSRLRLQSPATGLLWRRARMTRRARPRRLSTSSKSSANRTPCTRPACREMRATSPSLPKRRRRSLCLRRRSCSIRAGRTFRDILAAQAGITLGTGENGNAFGDRYVIRGHEARSDVFVDGVRDPGMTTRESFATEQIEITKGPTPPSPAVARRAAPSTASRNRRAQTSTS